MSWYSILEIVSLTVYTSVKEEQEQELILTLQKYKIAHETV